VLFNLLSADPWGCAAKKIKITELGHSKKTKTGKILTHKMKKTF